MSVRARILRFALGLALAVASTASVLAQGVDPKSNYIVSISYGGSGCPPGSVGSSISSDRQSATLIFDAFVASSGPGVPVTESRKNCQVTVNLNDTRGTKLFEIEATYRGYHQVASGQTASADATYDADIKQFDSTGAISVGPAAHDFVMQDSFKQSNRDGSRSILIKAQSRLVGPPGAQGQATIDSIDFKVTKLASVKIV